VEDDPEHVPAAAVHGAHAMAHLHAVVAAHTTLRAVSHREDHGLALPRPHDDGP
jgi:hypothetical protein